MFAYKMFVYFQAMFMCKLLMMILFAERKMEELEDKLDELQKLKQELEEEKDTLICTEGMMKFDSKAEVRDHYSKMHKDTLESNGDQKARLVRKINRHLCQLCGKHFADGWTLRHHQRTVHLESREHACRHCLKSFLSQKDMTRHVRGVHLGQRIVFPGTKKQGDTEICTVAGISVLEREGESRPVPNILKRGEGRTGKQQQTLVATTLEPLPKEDEEEEEEEEERPEILVKVEEDQVTAATDPPIFQLENLENLQFVLQEGSGEPQIVIPESGIRLTIPGEEREGQVLHLVPGKQPTVEPPGLGEDPSHIFPPEDFGLPVPHTELQFSPPAQDFAAVSEKVVTEVKFGDDLVDSHPKKFVYKRLHTSSSPHLVAVKELVKSTHAIEQFKCNQCSKCFISAVFLEKHIRQIHVDTSTDLGFIRTMINGNLETLELNTEYGDLNDLDVINSINIDVDACVSSESVGGQSKGEIENNIVLGSEDAFHEPIREVACKVCHKLFANKLALSKHRKSAHKRQQKHRCDDCGSEFTSRQTLRAHMSSIHEGIKKVCSICLKPVADLVRHVRSQHRNAKKKEYFCDVCESSFRTGFSLQRHKDTVHMKLKAWLCDLCEKTFGEKRDMLRHKNAIHFGIKNKHTKWTCPECHIVFKLRREYDEHKTTFHSTLTEEQVVKFLNAELESKKQKFHISAYKL